MGNTIKKKINNPFKKGSIIWSVMAGDWEDLTTHQIAEVLGSTYYTIRDCFETIRIKTGYRVPHAKGKPGRKTDL